MIISTSKENDFNSTSSTCKYDSTLVIIENMLEANRQALRMKQSLENLDSEQEKVSLILHQLHKIGPWFTHNVLDLANSFWNSI